MKKTNHAYFEELPKSLYFKTREDAKVLTKTAEELLTEIGFDKSNGGFLAIHRRHAHAALAREIPACAVLKRLGMAVILIEESGDTRSCDALVDEIAFEIKQISNAKNLKNAMLHQFRTARGKSPNLLLHIAQRVKSEQLRSALFYNVKKYDYVEQVWVVWRGSLFQFHREIVLKGKHQFSAKN
jgi:hypothetical protein